ncbi:MAG TPA: hypothetical protein VFN57_14180, partial [Thermomicrobiaceae bacterium]|nr:hypothetical protein [Thermomicrobiaceae bacterium]
MRQQQRPVAGEPAEAQPVEEDRQAKGKAQQAAGALAQQAATGEPAGDAAGAERGQDGGRQGNEEATPESQKAPPRGRTPLGRRRTRPAVAGHVAVA